ncbi:MAG: type IV secretory system conjugative DNA transfer family protein [Roseitalea porphyridii]|jgi:type IV secretion system protein VirD4|uniref:type IV secretory system conjugative DNA transfer family protein n=1 Tax=Roseitalea porphyridii TaxID=1852022 RepID=UPI0032EB6552
MPSRPNPIREKLEPIADLPLSAITALMTLITVGLLHLTDGAFLEPFIRWHGYGPAPGPLRVVSIVVAGSTGFALGWLISGRNPALRAVLGGVLLGVIGLLILFDYGVLGTGSTWLAGLIAIAAGLGYWLKAAASSLLDRLSHTPTTFGSAQWADMAEIDALGLTDPRGFRIGRFTDRDGKAHDLFYDGDGHLLTVAPTRSGKGTTAIIPNILTHPGSMLVIDPKGENARITAGHRKTIGQDVYIFDPWATTGMEGARFNPLDWLKAGDMEIGDNAMLLADAIVVPSAHAEPFWDREAKGVLTGLLIHVAIDAEEEGRRHLGRVRDLCLLDGDDLHALFTHMLASPHPMVRSTAARQLQKDDKLLANVLASLQAHTHFLDSPFLREAMASSDFDFADLKARALSVYLCLPADKLDSHGPVLRLLVQQAIAVNARTIESRVDHPVLFMLDEMAALGRLSMVRQAYGLMAGYGMQLWGIVQDLSQLMDIYGEGWETFIGNARVIQYYGSRDVMSAAYFSKLCGVTTVWDWTTAMAQAVGVSRGREMTRSATETETETVSGKQPQLAYADELMRLHPRRQVLFVENMNPIAAHRRPWFDDDDLKPLGVDLHAADDADPVTET